MYQSSKHIFSNMFYPDYVKKFSGILKDVHIAGKICLIDLWIAHYR